MEQFTKEENKRCHLIIHTASAVAASVGAGLAQIPLSDNAILTPVQLSMAVALGQVFGVELTQSSAKAAIGSASASVVGKAAVNLLVGWIPGVGNVINSCTAASVTEALGWVLARDFARQRAADLNPF